jgi:hypothetical protein
MSNLLIVFVAVLAANAATILCVYLSVSYQRDGVAGQTIARTLASSIPLGGKAIQLFVAILVLGAVGYTIKLGVLNDAGSEQLLTSRTQPSIMPDRTAPKNLDRLFPDKTFAFPPIPAPSPRPFNNSAAPKILPPAMPSITLDRAPPGKVWPLKSSK